MPLTGQGRRPRLLSKPPDTSDLPSDAGAVGLADAAADKHLFYARNGSQLAQKRQVIRVVGIEIFARVRRKAALIRCTAARLRAEWAEPACRIGSGRNWRALSAPRFDSFPYCTSCLRKRKEKFLKNSNLYYVNLRKRCFSGTFMI